MSRWEKLLSLIISIKSCTSKASSLTSIGQMSFEPLLIMNETLLVDLQTLMASIAGSLTCMCWVKGLFHAFLGPWQLDSAINRLLYLLLLALGLAPCWLQRAGSIIKQMKADCWVNFYPILPSGNTKSCASLKLLLKFNWIKDVQIVQLHICFLFFVCVMAQFYAALCLIDATAREKSSVSEQEGALQLAGNPWLLKMTPVWDKWCSGWWLWIRPSATGRGRGRQCAGC